MHFKISWVENVYQIILKQKMQISLYSNQWNSLYQLQLQQQVSKQYQQLLLHRLSYYHALDSL